MIRDLIKDMSKYLPAQIVPAIMGIIAIPIITRLFPPKDYGNYVLVMATVSILAAIVGWLSMSIIRLYPAYERDGKLKEFYSTVMKWLFISIGAMAVIFLSVLFATKNHIGIRLYRLTLIGILVFILTAGFGVLQHFLRAKRQVGQYSAFSVWKSVTSLGIGLILVIGIGFGVEGLLWGSILSMTIALPLLGKIALEKSSFTKSRISAGLTKEMAKYSFPLVVGSLAAWILSLSDRYILEFFRDSHEVGIYSASYVISEHSILLIVSLFMFASGPIGMNIWEKEGIKKSQEFVSKLTRYYLIICLPAVVGLSVLSKPVIGVLTGAEYYEGYRIVPLVAMGGFFLGINQRFQSGLIFYKKTNFIMITIIVSGLLNVGLNLLLVPRYGYMAAAVTTFISYFFLLFLMVVISKRIFIWEFPLQTLVKVSYASIIMGVVVYLIGNSLTSSILINLIAGITIGVIIYVLMLLMLREPKKEEIEVLYNITSRILGRRKR